MKPNETGSEYGDLVVKGAAASRHGKAYWRCECECGTIAVIKGSDLRNGKATHCGCKTAKPQPQPPFTLHMARQRITSLEAGLERLEALLSQRPVEAASAPPAQTATPEAAATPPSATPTASIAEAIERIEAIAAIPYKERGERMDALKEEMRLLIKVVSDDLRDVSDYNPGFKGDPLGAARADQLAGFMLALRKYHLNPEA